MLLRGNVFYSIHEIKKPISSLVIKRYFGGKSGNPMKKPKGIVPVKEQSLVNKVPFKSKGTSDLEKFKSQGLSENSTASYFKDPTKTFYEHNTIKPTISPYKVVPKESEPMVSKISSLSQKSKLIQISPKWNIVQRFGFKSFRELLFGPSQVNSELVAASEVPYNNNKFNLLHPSSPKGQLLVVAPSIPPSPYCPPDLDQMFYFKAHLITAVVFGAKCGMPLELNCLNAAYYKENCGENIHLLQSVVKGTVLNKPMNLLPLLPPNTVQVLPDGLIDTFKSLHLTKLGFAHETKSCMQLNESFSVPFMMNHKKLKHGSTVNNHLVYNNTGQENPDFARVIKRSNGSEVLDTYDLKSSVLPLKRLNHVRFVSDNQEKILLEAHDQVYTDIVLCQNNNPSMDHTVGDTILDHLESTKQQYFDSLDIHSFRRKYNSIRSEFADFFIDHEIPMTLIVCFDRTDFPIDISDMSFFEQAFNEFYYSPKTPVLKLYQEYLAINNNNVKDTTQFFKYLAKRLLESSDF